MHEIDVGKKTKVFVEDWGAGKQIIFVHGWPFSHRMFEYQMTALAMRDYRVIGIDLPGFGNSDKPWAGNDYDTWASDLGKIINALSLRDATMAGFSIGGAIAAHYLARYRDTRISKLALIASPVPSAWLEQQDRKMYDDFIEGLLQDRERFIHEFILKSLNRSASPEFIEALMAMARAASLRACLRGLEEMRDRDLRPEIGNIRVPVRIFHGVHDKVVPFDVVERQQRFVRNAGLIAFEDSGHALYWDEKERLVDELAGYAEEKLAKAS